VDSDGDPTRDDEGEALYETEKVVGHRVNRNCKEYRIRWKRCGAKDDCWQNKKYVLEFAKDVVKKYETDLKRRS
jgi:hypothetical protein